MEVDPLKLDPAPPGAPPIDNQELLASNMTKLLGATKDVLNAIISSSEMCPVGLKKLCFLIQKQVEQKFSKVQQNTMSQV